MILLIRSFKYENRTQLSHLDCLNRSGWQRLRFIHYHYHHHDDYGVTRHALIPNQANSVHFKEMSCLKKVSK